MHIGGWYSRTTVANGHRYSLYVAVLCIKVKYKVNMQKLKRTWMLFSSKYCIHVVTCNAREEYLRNET